LYGCKRRQRRLQLIAAASRPDRAALRKKRGVFLFRALHLPDRARLFPASPCAFPAATRLPVTRPKPTGRPPGIIALLATRRFGTIIADATESLASDKKPRQTPRETNRTAGFQRESHNDRRMSFLVQILAMIAGLNGSNRTKTAMSWPERSG
jgi:hypothetical protein